jgi:hypothetical protein
MTVRMQAASRKRPLREGRTRAPVDWRRYARYVRRAQAKLPRREHPVAVTLAASLVFAVAGSLVAQAIGVGIGTGIGDLGRSIVSTLPQAREADLVLGETQVTVSAAPILDPLPEFTKTNEVRVSGKVPGFAVLPDRAISLALNGRPLSTLAVGTDGRFGPAAVTLPDGTSTLQFALVQGTTEIATTSHTIVVDRVAPQLTIVRPKAADTVEGTDLIVEGKTEAGADVTVNDRALRPNPDGTFTERLVVSPGALKIAVVAKDKAGNETKSEISITVKEKSQSSTAGTALTVKLDRTTVKPSESVIAEIRATDGGAPKAGLAVTLSVGVITIGTYKTDADGVARIGFAAPNHEVEDVAVVVLGGGTSARATLTVAKK